MTAPWTEEQIRALAPDASSFDAARSLTDLWRDTGVYESALWGSCRGSGANPYRTMVDVAVPTHKCTCPSRKSPCKHTLSLLLLWTGARVPTTTTVPPFVGEWLASLRSKDGRAAVAKTANLATIEQRRARVTAGLKELDTWLADQVRTGLAQSDRSYDAFEAIAARMVDAQAPGVAATLRQLFSAVATQSHWPEVLLREYARLHLLARAHHQLDELPPHTQAAVRAHVGYPMQAESVRGEPKVRDHWMGLGRKTTEDDRLHTRRSWLVGRNTKRWAMLIEHSFGNPSFSGDIPLPGMQVDADVHFYPGSASLRIQWGERHGPVEPFTTIPAAGTIAEAFADHAAALGADPWLRTWPMVLANVVPVAGEPCWRLVESDGASLALTPGTRAWQLLAISGGHAVTVVGDWTSDGFEPVSVLTAGQVFDVIGDRVAAEAPARSQFAELVSVALVGTARRSPDHAYLEPSVKRALVGGAEPATRLLEAAAMQYLYLRGGEVPGTASCPPPDLDDARTLLPEVPAKRLASLLASRSSFLPEWFAAAESSDYRLPAELCVPALLAAASDAKLREPLLRLAGTRGRWLAGQNPEWSQLATTFGGVAPDAWLYGTPPERRAWLAEHRRQDPHAARDALATTWTKESGPLKAELIAVLVDGLTLDDEPLLERALDDRRADVRATAARLLSRLPGSGFEQRTNNRFDRWFHVDASGTLTVALPDTLDDADLRDGLADDPVRHVIAAARLDRWPRVRAIPDRFRQSILDGWIDATVARRDSRWAAALFGTHRAGELFSLLEPDEQIRRVVSADAKSLPVLIQALPHPWPDPIAEHVLGLFTRRARSTVRFFEAPERALMPATSVHAPVSFAPRFKALAEAISEPIWQQNLHRIAHSLSQRASMLEELK